MGFRNYIDGLVKILNANPSLEHVEVRFHSCKTKPYKKGVIIIDETLENVKFLKESMV
jgi:hypothetical protein